MKVNYHQPVLLRQVLENLAVKKDQWYLDATLGDGGHSLGILRLGGKVVGIDQDPEALERTQLRFRQERIKVGSYRLIRGNFRNLQELASGQKFAGALFDLGLSLNQLESARRGFSFQREGELDMRMDPELKVMAKDLVNILTCSQLSWLLKGYGDVRNRRIVRAIIDSRPITSTTQLAQVVARVAKRGRIHPATTVFQALRIAVNDELTALQAGLNQALGVTCPGGVIEVISFHSLEDRVVKNTYRAWHQASLGKSVTKKPVQPSTQEVQVNPRSRSAKLRVFLKK